MLSIKTDSKIYFHTFSNKTYLFKRSTHSKCYPKSNKSGDILKISDRIDPTHIICNKLALGLFSFMGLLLQMNWCSFDRLDDWPINLFAKTDCSNVKAA